MINEQDLDLGDILGATSKASLQLLRLYIPNKDRYGKEFGTQRKWVLEAANILADIGGGVTIMPAVEGGWMDENGLIVWEHPIIVYTFIRERQFLDNLPKLREFLHRLGRETNQGEIAFEFDNEFYRITNYDKI
ncbi:MAG: hypothetical protein WAQ98_08370 [Blastocatellia bacterium]